MVGALTSPEMNGVTTTDRLLKPVIEATGGKSIWLDEESSPTIRFTSEARRYGGSDWFAFKRNNDFTVTGVRNMPLLPEWSLLLILLSTLVYTWWIEGRDKR